MAVHSAINLQICLGILEWPHWDQMEAHRTVLKAPRHSIMWRLSHLVGPEPHLERPLGLLVAEQPRTCQGAVRGFGALDKLSSSQCVRILSACRSDTSQSGPSSWCMFKCFEAQFVQLQYFEAWPMQRSLVCLPTSVHGKPMCCFRCAGRTRCCCPGPSWAGSRRSCASALASTRRAR